MSHSEIVDVALVIDQLDRGGAERVLISIANNLAPDYFRPHVIVTREPGSLVSELADRVQLHSLNRYLRYDIGALYRFIKVLDDHHIQIVHAHNHTSFYFACLALLAWPRNCKLIMHDHHGPVETSPWLRRLDKILLKRADYYFGVSNRLLKYAIEKVGLLPGHCEILTNGIDVLPLGVQEKPAQFTIVQVARLVADKNHEMAIAAAARLRDSLLDFRWLMVGRVDEKSSYVNECFSEVYRKGLEKHIVFLGERNDIAKILKNAHVGVLTSSYEGLPISLLEYMAHGLPVVVTDVGDCQLVVENCRGGVVIPSNDSEALAQVLINLAGDPTRMIEYGRLNYARVKQYYSSTAMVQRIMLVYANLLGKPGFGSSLSKDAMIES